MMTETNDVEVLKKRIAILDGIVGEVMPMARRYANGRKTFAASRRTPCFSRSGNMDEGHIPRENDLDTER